ncbi:MAG: ABC transporter ATP-binding protein [Solirubrobacterales bacterium]
MSAEAAAAPRFPSVPRPRRTVIEVNDVHKTFRIPVQRVDTLKERALRMFGTTDYRVLEAIRGVSLEVADGEFVGIVGRNGSGKSTLLKILASIYRADRGTVRIAGRLAPFIELGVGFNPELTAPDNVALNGVMMGLTPREARRRYDAVIEFAELREFAELKLKNYSSGMLVRLAFALMLEVDADILIFDEVLAVGDASFQQRCAEAFRTMREEGKTIVLVTHDMHAVERNCHRALILEEGSIQAVGTPTEIAREYLEVNMRRHVARAPSREHRLDSRLADAFHVERAWVEDGAGRTDDSFPSHTPLRVNVELAAAADAPESFFSFELRNGEGAPLFATPYRSLAGDGRAISAGDRFRIGLSFAAPEGFDSYFVHCAVAGDEHGNRQYVLFENAVAFLAYDSAPPEAAALPYEFEIEAQSKEHS